MSDDLEPRLREALHGADLPGAPASTRAWVAQVTEEPRPGGARPRLRPLVILVPAAALLLAFVVFGGGLSAPTPSPSPSPGVPSPSPSAQAFPATVDGLPVLTVGEVLAARAAGGLRNQAVAVGGYWSDRSSGHSCPAQQTGDLEIYCHDGEYGITERDEPITVIDDNGHITRASVRHLTPWVPKAPSASLFNLPWTNGQPYPPVPIVVVGHFDDPRAAECRPQARQLCRDRLVIDRIALFDPSSVPAPTPTPIPTPFPIADPPPALFTTGRCYKGEPTSFIGWTTTAELNIQGDLPGYVYAMVTRDVIPIGNWYDSPKAPGHKARWWGRGVCFTQRPGGIFFGAVNGTSFLEVDDGRHILGQAP